MQTAVVVVGTGEAAVTYDFVVVVVVVGRSTAAAAAVVGLD